MKAAVRFTVGWFAVTSRHYNAANTAVDSLTQNILKYSKNLSDLQHSPPISSIWINLTYHLWAKSPIGLWTTLRTRGYAVIEICQSQNYLF